MHRFLTNTIILIFLSYIAHSQSVGEIKHYTISDGLSQSFITCIYQSKDGILWFGTQDGLNEYDGYNFTTIKKSSLDTNSLSNNYINDICEDNKGNLIIATKNGITLWKRKKDKFKKINITSDKEKTISNNEVYQVKYFDGAIWALTKKALVKIQGEKIKYYNYFVDTAYSNISFEKRTNNIKDLIADKNKNLWFTTNYGVEIFYPKSERFFRLYDNSNNKLSSNKARRLFEDSLNIWIGTFNGLDKYIKRTGTIKKEFYYRNNKKILDENTINSIFIDKNKTFWIGTNSGIKTLKKNMITDFSNEKINKIQNQISCIIKDNSNNIWAGTKYDGLYKISLDTLEFQNYSNLPKKNKYVFAIYVDTNKIWIGTRGLNIIDRKTKKNIFNTDLNKNITVYCLYNEGKNIWLGTDQGIYVVKKNTYKITDLCNYLKIKENKYISENIIYKIIKDTSGIYWIATEKGILEINKKNIIHFHKTNTSKSLSSNMILDILDDGNKLWIGTENGLNVLDKTKKTFKYWNTKNGIANNLVTDIYKKNDSVLWLSTGGGLSKFNIITKKFKNYTTENTGFINDFFYQILADKRNNLWVSSNYGIVKFNEKTHQFYTYTERDGIPFLEFNTGASFKTTDSLFFFGGSGGIVWCNANRKNSYKKPQKIIITKLEIKNSFSSSKSTYFPDSTLTYKIKYNRIVTISFTLPDYHNSSDNRYQFKVKGLNNKWSAIQKENSVSLIGLSPGKYTIFIKGENSFNKWNNNYAKINIEIIPPFNKSIYSKILIGTLILLLLIFVFLYIYRNIKVENKILQEKNVVLKQVDEQKKLLEEKNKSITDSINYAKKIIEAILPRKEELQKYIPESFVFFLPKDIVSGDFYWFIEKNDNIFIAAVDCTGHGIPGAFMSIIGLNLLNHLVNEGINDPSVILNMMNKEVILTLKKNLDTAHLKDGMDMSLAIIDKKRQIIKFSCAYNPAYLIRDNNIIQLKGERKSVGNDFDFDSFSTFSMKIRKDDIVYLFSDGYTDQFGGEEQKKFKFRRFRFILLSIHKLEPKKQKDKLKETFEKWKGSNDQVDDILIIGFKPLSFSNI